MIAFLRNFCASLAALIVFFIAVPFTFLVIIAAVIASIGEKDKLEVSKGGVLVLDLSDGVSETSPASNFKIRGKFFKTPPESTFDICAKIRAAAICECPVVKGKCGRLAFGDIARAGFGNKRGGREILREGKSFLCVSRKPLLCGLLFGERRAGSHNESLRLDGIQRAGVAERVFGWGDEKIRHWRCACKIRRV